MKCANGMNLNMERGITMVNERIEDKTANLWRSYDSEMVQVGNPYKLLASAIVFQAAVDCEMVARLGEDSFFFATHTGYLPYVSVKNLEQFIKSDWLALLLAWQGDISTDAVRQELERRLHNETVPA